jgi:hypothetical protein
MPALLPALGLPKALVRRKKKRFPGMLPYPVAKKGPIVSFLKAKYAALLPVGPTDGEISY